MKLYRLKYGDGSPNISDRRYEWTFMATCAKDLAQQASDFVDPENARYSAADQRAHTNHREIVRRFIDHVVGFQYETYTRRGEERIAIFLLLDCPTARLLWRLAVSYSDYDYPVEIESETSHDPRPLGFAALRTTLKNVFSQ